MTVLQTAKNLKSTYPHYPDLMVKPWSVLPYRKDHSDTFGFTIFINFFKKKGNRVRVSLSFCVIEERAVIEQGKCR